jgi:hypothetical protein
MYSFFLAMLMFNCVTEADNSDNSIQAWSATAHKILKTNGLLDQRDKNLRTSLLGLLDSQDLRELGITNVADRLHILSAMQEEESGKSDSQLDDKFNNDFTFVASYVNSTRQFGKCIHFSIKYRYHDNISLSNVSAMLLDYRDVRDHIISHYAQPSDVLPMDTQWEIINYMLVHDLLTKYNKSLKAISSQIQVKSEITGYWEPGNHGSTMTLGDISPIADSFIDAFDYDCTLEKGSSK